MAVTPDGRLKLMELNTGCPGGFLIAEAMSNVTRHGFSELDGLLRVRRKMGTQRDDPTDTHWSTNSWNWKRPRGIEPDAIGILNDENNLIFELDLLPDAFRKHGRQVAIADAATLHRDGDRLMLGSQVLSLVYNKFRISTPKSRNHCWQSGLRESLCTISSPSQQGHEVVSVNNFGGMLLAEDKSLLAVLHEPTSARF